MSTGKACWMLGNLGVVAHKHGAMPGVAGRAAEPALDDAGRESEPAERPDRWRAATHRMLALGAEGNAAESGASAPKPSPRGLGRGARARHSQVLHGAAGVGGGASAAAADGQRWSQQAAGDQTVPGTGGLHLVMQSFPLAHRPRQFRKNLRLQLRQKAALCCQLVFPVVLILFLWLMQIIGALLSAPLPFHGG